MTIRHNIAVILHLYFPELWEDIDNYLRNLEGKFDLYVSVPFTADSSVIDNIVAAYPTARVIGLENRGRDVAPFVEIYSAIAPLYEYICKIHSKRSTRISGGSQWRQALYDELLGSVSRVNDIIAAFDHNPNIGMIGPAGHAISIRSASITGFQAYKHILTYLAQKIGIDRIDQLEYSFFSGTMFWFRSDAFRPLIDLAMNQEMFEPEVGAVDGTLAHAMERFFPVIVFSAGYQIFDTDLLAPDSVSGLNPVYDIPPDRRLERTWQPPKIGKPGVNLIGPVEFLHGLSISARAYASCLISAGIRLNVVPWRIGFERLKRIDVDYPEESLQPINLVHLNLDLLTSEKLLDSGQLARIVTGDRYNICIPYWELAKIPPEWHETLNRFDEVWCASTFVADAVSAAFKGVVKVLRPALELPPLQKTHTRKELGLPEDKFIFFYAADFGSIMGRKNPMALIHAYIEEFQTEEGACCLIKINYANRSNQEIREIISLTKHRQDVIFLDKLLDDEHMHALFQHIDCYVSPHRSEGLGQTIIEAMSFSKPVIATPYGGVTDFVTPESAFPLDYKLIQVGEGNAPYPSDYVWADPSISSLKNSMRRVFVNREEADKVGKNGWRLSHNLFSLEKTSPPIYEALHKIWLGGSNSIPDL